MSQHRRRHRHLREMIALAVALGVITSFVAVGWLLM